MTQPKRLTGLDAYDFHVWCSAAKVPAKQTAESLRLYEQCRTMGLWGDGVSGITLTHEIVAKIEELAERAQ